MPRVEGAARTLRSTLPRVAAKATWIDTLRGKVRAKLGTRAVQSMASSGDEKGAAELGFWVEQAKAQGGRLRNDHYRELFTTAFGLTDEDFAGRRVLDVGCGPRGSLEWADGAAERVGLDPLADDYRTLGTARHAMRYVNAPAERMPFEDGAFDVVATLNSLDHVDDLDATIAELTRVCAPGGRLLLMCEVGHEPTPTEPLTFEWDVLDRFRPAFDVALERRFEMVDGGVYVGMWTGRTWDETDTSKRAGFLVARLERVAA